MLDREGYRPNVGIVLINSRNEVFWGNALGSIRGSFHRAVFSMAKALSRPCTANCMRK